MRLLEHLPTEKSVSPFGALTLPVKMPGMREGRLVCGEFRNAWTTSCTVALSSDALVSVEELT